MKFFYYKFNSNLYTSSPNYAPKRLKEAYKTHTVDQHKMMLSRRERKEDDARCCICTENLIHEALGKVIMPSYVNLEALHYIISIILNFYCLLFALQY